MRQDEIGCIKLGALPKDFLEDISRQIFTYTICLFIVNEKIDSFYPIGSGVLSEICGKKGILTAKHVADELKTKNNCYLGTLLYERVDHNFYINVSLLAFFDFSIENTSKQFFPDISFIELPLSKVSTIQSIKSFYPFAKDKESLLLFNDSDIREGIWFVCGFPVYKSIYDFDIERNRKTLNLIGRCGATGVEKITTEHDYDFYEVIVDYSSNDEIPLNFEGMSGGGLWKVPFKKEKDKLIPMNYSLCGLVIEQTAFDKTSNVKSLICHGRKSLYKYFYDFMESKV